jgi:hypothetical protein
MPQAMEGLLARAEGLSCEVARVEQDIGEAEAKHELYKLLETRTGCVGGGETCVGGWVSGGGGGGGEG